MKRIARVLLVFVLVTLLLGAGAIVSANRGWFQPIATIQIENRSGQALRALEVKHESRGVNSTAKLPSLASGEAIRFRFYVAGEGGYTVHAVLADGTAPKDSEGYVESGYVATEIITKAAILRANGYVVPVR